jgi:hypothetical protein
MHCPVCGARKANKRCARCAPSPKPPSLLGQFVRWIIDRVLDCLWLTKPITYSIIEPSELADGSRATRTEVLNAADAMEPPAAIVGYKLRTSTVTCLTQTQSLRVSYFEPA